MPLWIYCAWNVWLIGMYPVELNFEVVHIMCVVDLVKFNSAVESEVLASFDLRGYLLNAFVISYKVALIDFIAG